jgi:Tol biopolymer transport system component
MRWIRVRTFVAASAIISMAVIAGPAPAHAAFPGENGRIVFDTVSVFWNGTGPSNIYTVEPDGSDLKRLTDVPDGSAAWHPSVSPSGGRIVYVMSREGRNDQVWIMHADGSHQHRLVHEPAWSGSGPSFTAGGHRVLYSRCGNYVAFYFTCKIVSVRLDGSGLRTIIGGTWHPFDPVMSPDGSKVAYVSDAGGFEGRLWLADADGSNRSVIGPTFVERLSWSPDGSQLTFTGGHRNGAGFTINVDGTGLQKILPGSLFPAWSPDGASIVSHGEGPNGFGPLRITGTDGSDPVEIVDAYLGVGFVDWGVAR